MMLRLEPEMGCKTVQNRSRYTRLPSKVGGGLNGEVNKATSALDLFTRPLSRPQTGGDVTGERGDCDVGEREYRRQLSRV